MEHIVYGEISKCDIVFLSNTLKYKNTTFEINHKKHLPHITDFYFLKNNNHYLINQFGIWMLYPSRNKLADINSILESTTTSNMNSILYSFKNQFHQFEFLKNYTIHMFHKAKINICFLHFEDMKFSRNKEYHLNLPKGVIDIFQLVNFNLLKNKYFQ